MASLIHPAVRDAWLPWNAPIEGIVSWMYLDIRGLVTTGLGQLCDPCILALALPWQSADGISASTAQVESAWQAVKANLALAHEGAAAAEDVTVLRLPQSDIAATALATLDRYAAILAAFPALAGFGAWPADAQLGALSMAWAMGPGFPRLFPHWCADCQAGDWTQAAVDCWMADAGNAALRRRNLANRALFAAAAKAADPAVLSAG
jgi:GH24 family phage-related lysozyme (muramidase)